MLGQVTGLREYKSSVSAQEAPFEGCQLTINELGAQRGELAPYWRYELAPHEFGPLLWHELACALTSSCLHCG